MNDVSIATEVTSVKTAPTQRRRKVERIETNTEIGAQAEIDPRSRRSVKHRVENKTNKAKVETKKGSEK